MTPDPFRESEWEQFDNPTPQQDEADDTFPEDI
jgi:hypothetical protein